MNLERNKRAVVVLALLSLVITLSGCGTSQTVITPTATREIKLTPYSSPTPSQPSGTSTPRILTPTTPPTATPTPVTYTIAEGDTMLAIAFKNGISLAELQEANPDVNPRLMSVGTELIIPLGESIPSVPMTPTPLPLNTKPPVCYLTPDGIWCFLLVNNDRARPLENISAQMILFDSGGEAVTNGDAIAPINHLLPSKSIPLVLFMAGEYLPGTSAVANIITAQFIPKEDDRYLNAWIETDQTEISNSGKSVQVEGMYGVPLKSAASGSVWIVAVAYDQNGDVVGFKKLEIYEELEPGGSRDFSLEISSLGLPIERVELLIEARPVPELDQDEESS